MPITLMERCCIPATTVLHVIWISSPAVIQFVWNQSGLTFSKSDIWAEWLPVHLQKACVMPSNTWWLQNPCEDKHNFSTCSQQQCQWVVVPHQAQIPSLVAGSRIRCTSPFRKTMWIALIARPLPEPSQQVGVWGGWFAYSCTKVS